MMKVTCWMGVLHEPLKTRPIQQLDERCKWVLSVGKNSTLDMGMRIDS